MNKNLNKALYAAQVNGCCIGISAVCSLIGGAIWNAKQDLDLTDDQAKGMIDRIQPEIDKLLKVCNAGDLDAKKEMVEYVCGKAQECAERMKGND